MGVRVKQDVPIRVELTVMLKNIVVAQSIFTAADAEEGLAPRPSPSTTHGQAGSCGSC